MVRISFLKFIFPIFFVSIIYATSQEEEKEEVLGKIVFTPLKSNSSGTCVPVSSVPLWSEDQVEKCKQVYLYEGGLFKKGENVCQFSEMNNYLTEHRAYCVEFDGQNIYLGTENGIFLSTDGGATWLKPDDDGIDNLIGRRILSLAKREIDNTTYFFAGTNDGLFISTDDCVSWSQTLDDYRIFSIEFKPDNSEIFVGAYTTQSQGSGIHSSTDMGNTWTLIKPLSGLQNCSLKWIDNSLFSGIHSTVYMENGFWEYYNDNGQWTWSKRAPRWPNNYDVTSFVFYNNYFYLGTINSGIRRIDRNFYQDNGWNDGLPTNNGEYPQINSLILFPVGNGAGIYAGTENGLYYRSLSSGSWVSCLVYDNGIGTQSEIERKIKGFKITQENGIETLWVVCYGAKRYESAEMVDSYPSPMNPENFPNFNCHSFAWHFVEGGETNVVLRDPKQMKYIPSDENLKNWDYIKCEWNDPDWEKVTYGTKHSGIRDPEMQELPSQPESLWVISKWGKVGPLVRHKLRDNPWGSSDSIKFWKSKRIIFGSDIEREIKIGRVLETKKDDSVVIESGSEANFLVAPMYGHKIHLQSGFHAKNGSTFHAYIQDEKHSGVEIPWEGEDCTMKTLPLAYTKGSDRVNKERSAIQNVTYDEKESLLNGFDDCSHKPFWCQFSGKGSGSKDDPYQISNFDEFMEFLFKCIEDTSYFILVNDIDLYKLRDSSMEWWRDVILDGGIDYSGGRARYLDGQGHVIRGLYSFYEHFIQIQQHCIEIKRVGFEDVLIMTSACNKRPSFVKAYFPVTFFGLQKEGDPTDPIVIEECYVTGKYKHCSGPWDTIIIGPWPQFSFGFGPVTRNVLFKNCYVDLEIEVDSNLYAFGAVMQDSLPDNGFTGMVNCYARVRTPAKKQVFSPFGYKPPVKGCFWDADLLRITEPYGLGVGLTTEEMKQRWIFETAGWDLENVWYIDDGKDYPRLRAFMKTTDVGDKATSAENLELQVNEYSSTNLFKGRYSIPEASPVEISLYNQLGEKVKIIVNNSTCEKGQYSFEFDADNLSTGLYLVVLKTSTQLISKKIFVIN